MAEFSFPIKSENGQIKLTHLFNSMQPVAKLGKEKYVILSILFDEKFFIKYVEVSRERGTTIENSFIPTSKIKFLENKIYVFLDEEKFFDPNDPLYEEKIKELTLSGLKYFGEPDIAYYSLLDALFALFKLPSGGTKVRISNSNFPLVEVLINPLEWRITFLCFKKGLFKETCLGIEEISYFDEKTAVFYSK